MALVAAGSWCIVIADRERLRMALDVGWSWHAVSVRLGIPYSTVKKHARLLGYTPHRTSLPTEPQPG
jgi:hypothetical protein